MLYLWLKALHIVSMVCWFAGLFYLPRLFVYHAQSEDTVSKERFSIMERKLYRGIMGPAMIATLVFGIALIYLNPSIFSQGAWIHAKLTLVVLLIADRVSFGSWQLPLKFVQSADGGSCAPGCHRPAVYDRKNPGKKP